MSKEKKTNGKIDTTPVDTSRIKVGEVYKNYKALCEQLGVEHKGGNSKIAHEKSWERYFKYVKEGHKIEIVKIHPTPMEVTDLREKGGNNVKYLNKIEYLILDLLAKEHNEGKVFISKNMLLDTLDIVNANYSYGKYNKNKISEYTSFSKYSVEDFYDTTDSVLKRNLSSALKSLADKSLIFCKEVMTVTVAETQAHINKDNKIGATRKIETNSRGRRIVSFNTSGSTVSPVTRKASKEETNEILLITNSTLKEFGCKKISEVFARGMQSSFYGRVNEILFRDHNIDNYFLSYEIFFNHKNVVEEKNNLKDLAIEEGKRIASVMDLNEDIINRLKENLQRRQMDAEVRFLDTEKEEYAFRMTDEYAEEQEALMSIMIAFGSDIIEELVCDS